MSMKNAVRGPKLPDDIAAMSLEQAEAALAEIDGPKGKDAHGELLRQRDHYQALLEARSERRTNLSRRIVQLLEAKVKR